MGITVIRDLKRAAEIFEFVIEGRSIDDIIKESKYYRHPDSATISYAKIAEETIGKISDKALDIGIVGAGPSGICALYELSKIDHDREINVSLYECDDRNFIFERFGGLVHTRAGRVSSTMTNNDAVYEIGAMRFPDIAGLTWYYAGELFGKDTLVKPFPNPGAVTTEFVSGDRVDHYKGNHWEDSNSPTLKVKELVGNELWKGDYYKIGDKTPEEVSCYLKGKDTPPDTLRKIHDEWKQFVADNDGTTLGSAVHKIISYSIDKLPDINGLSSPAEKINYYFELFGHFGFGTGPFKPVFNMSLVEMMRLLLWNYYAEYLFPVKENTEFIRKLYSKAKDAKNFNIHPKYVKVCDVFHRVDEGKPAGVAFYNLEDKRNEPVNIPNIEYHDYIILAIPQVPATQITSRFGSTTVPIKDGKVGIPSIGIRQIDEDILPPLMLSTKNGEEAANTQLTAAIDGLHMTRSAKVFATIKTIDANIAPKFEGKPIQAVLSDCGLASSYIVPNANPEYDSFLVSYTWEDDSTRQQYDYYNSSNSDEIKSTVINTVFGKIVDRSYRWIRDVSNNDNKYILWWLHDFLGRVNDDKFFFDWSAQSSAGGFKLDLTKGHYQSDLCFRYHTHAASALNNRFFLASCSFSHLGGWLEGAFMSAINAVSGIVVSANGGGQEGINALNSEAQKL
ncbi:7251_t:CDS:1, partial [Scutellospora calospora]